MNFSTRVAASGGREEGDWDCPPLITAEEGIEFLRNACGAIRSRHLAGAAPVR